MKSDKYVILGEVYAGRQLLAQRIFATWPVWDKLKDIWLSECQKQWPIADNYAGKKMLIEI